MRLHLLATLAGAAAWSALGEPTPVTLDPTQSWVGEIVRQGGGWALAVYVIWIQHRDHRESATRRNAAEERLLDQLAASTAALQAAQTAIARLADRNHAADFKR